MRQSKRRRSGFLSLLGLLCLSGCANQPCQDDLSRLVNVGIDNASSSLSGIRYTGLRDTALSIGARGGLASRAKEINNEILTQSVYLDRIFNFNALILNDNIVPPVLTQSRQLLEQTEDDSLRLADRSYHIIAQAYFMSSAPTWQDYLLFHCPAPELPDRSLLPKNNIEKKIWDRYIVEGWHAGRLQADTIFLENLSRLKRNYEGMILYRTLLAQNIVTPPFIAKQTLGITCDDNNLIINDRILRITLKPAFECMSNKWKTTLIAKETQLPFIHSPKLDCPKLNTPKLHPPKLDCPK